MSTTCRLCLALAAIGLIPAPALLRGSHAASPPAHRADECVEVKSRVSLLHLGSLDSFDITRNGTDAATKILDCIERDDPESARGALAIYEQLIPRENFGGEYTALQWLCEYLVATPRQKEQILADKPAANYFHFLSDNNYAVLKEYLRRKYHLDKAENRSDFEATDRFRFYEDVILFNNPRRASWEKTDLILKSLGFKPGEVVADIGCGPGYYTFKIGKLVGEEGRVFAIDNNDRHLEYLSRLIKAYDAPNIQLVRPSFGSTNLPEGVKIDHAFMCALYYVLYASMGEGERAAFIDSIKRHLKPDGTLVIVENAMVEDPRLPYHGHYIAKELVIRQLKHYGFTLAATHQFIPQRYVLAFKLSGAGPESSGAQAACTGKDCIPIESSLSLAQFNKPGPTPGFTRGGRQAARLFYRALDRHDESAARAAMALYRDLLPRERFGDEYSAFAWYCEYILAPPEARKALLADRFVAEYFRFLGGDDFTILKKYVWNKYDLDLPDEDFPKNPAAAPRRKPIDVDLGQLNDWGAYIAFNNPRRETWEKTGEVLKFLALRPGSSVADVGCGPGFYTFKFSELVGREGRVYAVETGQEMLEHVGATAARLGLSNIEPVLGRLNETKLPPRSVDVVFLCSLYHAVYVTSIESVKDQFIASIKRALRPGGRLVIADNDVLPEDQNPYYGPRIDRRLTILQLRHYGFRLVDTAQFIPQRYILAFELDPQAPPP